MEPPEETEVPLLEGLFAELLVDYRQMFSSRLLIKSYLERAEQLGVKDYWLSLPGQQLFHQKVILDPVCRQYPPSPVYSVSCIRFFLAALTEAGCAMDEYLMEAFFEMNNLKPISDGVIRDVCHKTYSLSDMASDLLTIRMANQLDSVGLTTWEAGFFLAEFMVLNPEIFEGRNLLELGSGVGITGIVLAKKVKIKKLVMTDYTEQVNYNLVIANLKQNVEINKVSESVEVHELDWEYPKLVSDTCGGDPEKEFEPEIIFVADCVYDPDLINALVKVLKHFLTKKIPGSDSGTVPTSEGQQQNHFPCAYVASTLRNPTTFEHFIKTLNEHGIKHVDVTPENKIHGLSPMLWKYDYAGTIFLTFLYCEG